MLNLGAYLCMSHEEIHVCHVFSVCTYNVGLAVAKTGSGGTLSNTDVSRLRQIIGELSFKLSQLQHYSDTVQREKSAMEQKSHENERLLKSTIDR